MALDYKPQVVDTIYLVDFSRNSCQLHKCCNQLIFARTFSAFDPLVLSDWQVLFVHNLRSDHPRRPRMPNEWFRYVAA